MGFTIISQLAAPYTTPRRAAAGPQQHDVGAVRAQLVTADQCGIGKEWIEYMRTFEARLPNFNPLSSQYCRMT